MQIAARSLTGIMGGAGCGKSTLCLTFNGLIPHFIRGRLEGEVRVKGQSVSTSSVAELARIVGLLFQDFEAQLFSTSAELEIAFGPENYNVTRTDIIRRVDEYLRLLELAELRHRAPTSLSGGQQQRLAIASILALEPDIVVMDEPTTDLDSAGRDHLIRLAAEIRRTGRTVVIVEHDPESLTTADSITLIKDGTVAASGSAPDILTDVSLLTSCNIRPPQLADLFYRLDIPDCPLTVSDCLGVLRRHHPRLASRVTAPARAPGPASVALLNVSYKYPDADSASIHDFSLTIYEGEFVAIAGENGSGKTTVAKLLSGLLHPDTGDATLRGTSIRSLPRHIVAGQIGYVFQNPDHQIFCATVEEEVSFSARRFGIPREELAPRVTQSLRTVGLQGYEERDPFGLTKGERQRVAVASVLVLRPEIIVLDEPTTGLDYRQHSGMMSMLRRLNQSGHTVIIVTHSMSTLAEYADRTVVLHEGDILIDGPTRDVLVREDLLAHASLRPPPVVQLSNMLGAGIVSVAEMAAVFNPGASAAHHT